MSVILIHGIDANLGAGVIISRLGGIGTVNGGNVFEFVID